MRNRAAFVRLVTGMAACLAVTGAVADVTRDGPIRKGTYHGEYQCVGYVRDHHVAALPRGLVSREAKRALLSAPGHGVPAGRSSPKPGWVAIVDIGPYGHVAYVDKVDAKGKKKSLTLLEANRDGRASPPYSVTKTRWNGSAMSEIEQTARIIGYWKP